MGKKLNLGKKFIEPQLLKAGSALVSLGWAQTPPKVDCRVLAEDNYQILKKVYDKYGRIENQKVLLLNSFIDSVGEYIKEQENHEVKRTISEITRIKAVAFWCIKFARKLSF